MKLTKRLAHTAFGLVVGAFFACQAEAQSDWTDMGPAEYRYDKFEDATVFSVGKAFTESPEPGDLVYVGVRFWCDGDGQICDPDAVTLCFAQATSHANDYEGKLIWLIDDEKRLSTTNEVPTNQCGSGMTVIKQLTDELLEVKGIGSAVTTKIAAFQTPGGWIDQLGKANSLEFKIGQVTGSTGADFRQHLAELSSLIRQKGS